MPLKWSSCPASHSFAADLGGRQGGLDAQRRGMKLTPRELDHLRLSQVRQRVRTLIQEVVIIRTTCFKKG